MEKDDTMDLHWKLANVLITKEIINQKNYLENLLILGLQRRHVKLPKLFPKGDKKKMRRNQRGKLFDMIKDRAFKKIKGRNIK